MFQREHPLEPGRYDVVVRGTGDGPLPAFTIQAEIEPVTGYAPGIAHRFTTPTPTQFWRITPD